MVDMMSGSTEAAFDMAGLLSDEKKAEFAAARTATQAMVDQLETKYASRGLKFTRQFHGACPVQAYGHVDGLRFYFRFRGNWGSIKVGPFVEEIERLYALRQNEDIEQRKAQREAEGRKADMWEELEQTHYPVAETDLGFYPHVVTKYAELEGADPEDFYNGYLTNEEAFGMFSRLLDSLEDVPVEKQMDESTRIWLYEGRDAQAAYDLERERIWKENGGAEKALADYQEYMAKVKEVTERRLKEAEAAQTPEED